jgi:hypothetical protein
MQSLHAVWNAGRAVAHLSLTQGLKVQTNNVAGRNYSSVTSIAAPVVDLKVLHRSPSNEHLWSQVAHARLNLGLDMYSAPPGWEETAHKQREFLAEQDAATGRFLGNFTQANGKSHSESATLNPLVCFSRCHHRRTCSSSQRPLSSWTPSPSESP